MTERATRGRAVPAVVMAVSVAVLAGVGVVWWRDAQAAAGVGDLAEVVGTSTETAPAAAPPAPPTPAPGVTQVSPAAPAAPAPPPVRLQVARLGVDARVTASGVTADGQAEVPKDARRVGWYRFGPAPGDPEGSAVIVGHRDSRTQGQGALFPLLGARVGDAVVVTRGDGSRLAYRVVERRLYQKSGVPWDIFFDRDGAPRLTLVTCGGPYDRARGGYQDNLVVSAVPVAGTDSSSTGGSG